MKLTKHCFNSYFTVFVKTCNKIYIHSWNNVFSQLQFRFCLGKKYMKNNVNYLTNLADIFRQLRYEIIIICITIIIIEIT